MPPAYDPVAKPRRGHHRAEAALDSRSHWAYEDTLYKPLNRGIAMKAAGIDRRDSSYPTNHVVGTIGDADKARAAIDALLQAGFDLHGEEDLRRLDPTGVEHGFFAQFQRTFIRTFDLDEFKHLTHHVEDVRAGRFVIRVLTKRRVRRVMAADILHQHGAEYVGFYGRWAWEDLPAHPQNSPEDVPVMFARAWNARDPVALASLFDADAEFVHVTGLCWHNRESIRQAHADRLARVLRKSTMSPGETKVKLLSPEVAVVHTRMTLSGEESGGATPAGPRASIFTFVVHRAGGRWLCASAHNTDVIPNPETPLIDEAGVFGAASYPSDQMS
jgi:uncharacterized protein (TIGR02246 family)